MAFSSPVATLLAFRAAYICSNPECNCLTAGPALDSEDFKVKIGEAAHIVGEGMSAARYRKFDKVGDISNGIWLCASCHSLVDKNHGEGYPEERLHEWKRDHEKMVGMLVSSHRTPFPILIRQTLNAQIARQIAIEISNRGVFTADHVYEVGGYVLQSVETFRQAMVASLKSVNGDDRLRKIINQLIKASKTFMNETSPGHADMLRMLENLRDAVALAAYHLEEFYGVEFFGEAATLRHRVPVRSR